MPQSARRHWKPREERRKVMLAARLLANSGWSDACILNISSRGLMVHVQSAAPRGEYVELRKGQHVIVARIVWREAERIGLLAQDRLPVDRIIHTNQAAALQLTAGDRTIERRARSRDPERSRMRGRSFEFVCVVFAGAALATLAYSTVERTLSRPLAEVRAALGG